MNNNKILTIGAVFIMIVAAFTGVCFGSNESDATATKVTDSNNHYTQLEGTNKEIPTGTYEVAVGCTIKITFQIAPAQFSLSVSDDSYGITAGYDSSIGYRNISGTVAKTGTFTVKGTAIDGSSGTYTFTAYNAASSSSSSTSDGKQIDSGSYGVKATKEVILDVSNTGSFQLAAVKVLKVADSPLSEDIGFTRWSSSYEEPDYSLLFDSDTGLLSSYDYSLMNSPRDAEVSSETPVLFSYVTDSNWGIMKFYDPGVWIVQFENYLAYDHSTSVIDTYLINVVSDTKTLTLNEPNTQYVVSGSSVSFTASASANTGSPTISYSVSSVPDGFTVTVSGSTVTVKCPTVTAIKDYTFTLTASASGYVSASTDVTVHMVPVLNFLNTPAAGIIIS